MISRLALLGLAFILAGCQSQPSSSLATASSTSLSAGVDGTGAPDPRFAVIVMDADTGKTLFADNPDALRYPASLTKMMTMYLLFEALQSGRVSLDTPLMVSAHAAAQEPTKLGLVAGSTIRVEDAIDAIAVHSCNDVAVAIAENLAASEPVFVERMTRTARALGLSRTTFRNASGLPDPGQMTTARDMATLGMALQSRFPQYARAFSLREFSYGGRTYKSTNELLGEVPGVDGIKTGYTNASGYNLVGSIRRDDRHIVAVVMGEPTSRSRNALMARLLESNVTKGGGWLSALR